jgi:L-ascorbate metabolism protein UlaG (beta-lactamase superfamily)
LNIRFLGNACIEVIGNIDHIIIDPVYDSSPKKGIQKIFITHDHSDHFSLANLKEIRIQYTKEDYEPEIYYPVCVQEDYLIHQNLITPGMKVDLNKGYVDVFENECWKAMDCVAYLITIDNKKLLHTADSANFSNQLRNIEEDIDVCFVACFESNFKDYLEFFKKKSPKIAIPYHFTYKNKENAEKLVKYLSNAGINSRYLKIGEELNLT